MVMPLLLAARKRSSRCGVRVAAVGRLPFLRLTYLLPFFCCRVARRFS